MPTDWVAHSDHAQEIGHTLQILYGNDRAGQAIGFSVRVDSVVRQLCTDSLACFYYFGHGSPEKDGGLCLSDACLDSGYLRNRLTPVANRTGRLAFLNCCWSAACLSPDAIDPARAFLEGGWSTIVGTVLPPLDLVAAPFAENWFKLLLAYQCNAHRAFFEALCETWEQYRKEPTATSFAWASYRLYGVDGERYVWTPAIRPSGDLFYLGHRMGSVDSFDFSPEQFALLCEVFGAANAETMFPRLIYEEHLQPVAKAAFSLFAQNGEFPFGGKLKDIVIDALLQADRSANQSSVGQPIPPALGAEELLDAIENVAEEVCPIRVSGTDPWKPIALTDSAEAVLLAFCRKVDVEGLDPHKACLDLQQATKHEFGRKSWLGVIRQKPDVAAILRAAWALCESEPRLVHLFGAALVQGLGEGLERTGLDQEMQEGISSDDCDPTIADPNVCWVLTEADWRRGIAGDQPFWWHVLVVLARSHDPSIAGLARDGLYVKDLTGHVGRLHAAREVRVAMREAVDRGGRFVGHSWLKLPNSVLARWKANLQDAIEGCEHQGQVVLAVPWEPSVDANVDALASEIQGQLMGERDWRSRVWVHFGADDLVVLPIIRPLFWRSRAEDVRRILNEGRNREVLFVSGGRQVRDDNWSQWKQEAGAVLTRMHRGNIKGFIVLARDEASEPRMTDFFGKNGVDIVSFDPLEPLEIRDLVAAWEKRRGRRPIDDALSLLVNVIAKPPAERRLTAAIEIWNEACRTAKGVSPSRGALEKAARDKGWWP